MNYAGSSPQVYAAEVGSSFQQHITAGASPVTQKLHVTNSQHGTKPLMLRLRLSFIIDGKTITDQVEVKNLPAGL